MSLGLPDASPKNPKKRRTDRPTGSISDWHPDRLSRRGGRVLEWYRLDPTRRLLPIWTKASLMVLAGVVLLGFCFVEGGIERDAVKVAVLLVGLVIIGAGPLYAAIAALSTMSEETYIVLRSDGLLFSDPPIEPVFVAWQNLVRVEKNEESPGIQLVSEVPATGRQRTHVLAHKYLGIGSEALAKRISAVQRQGLMNIV